MGVFFCLLLFGVVLLSFGLCLDFFNRLGKIFNKMLNSHANGIMEMRPSNNSAKDNKEQRGWLQKVNTTPLQSIRLA